MAIPQQRDLTERQHSHVSCCQVVQSTPLVCGVKLVQTNLSRQQSVQLPVVQKHSDTAWHGT